MANETRLEMMVTDGAASVNFYLTALDGRENSRECLLDGHVLSADITVGDYRLSLVEWPSRPLLRRSAACSLSCPDPHAVAERCAAVGALIKPDGEVIVIQDLDGYHWTLTAS